MESKGYPPGEEVKGSRNGTGVIVVVLLALVFGDRLLRGSLVLGKSLNRYDPWLSRGALVALLLVIGPCEMNIESWGVIVGAGFE